MRKIMPVLALSLLVITGCNKKETIATRNDAGTKALKPGFTPFMIPPGATPVTFTFNNGKKLPLYQLDTNYILEGDMVLTPTQVELIKKNNSNSGAGSRTFTMDVTKLWPNGVVPYVINSAFSTSDRNSILTALSDLQSTGFVSFVQRTNQSDYVEFMTSTNINNSNVGRTGGRQVINLNTTNGVFFTSAEHEACHALGMYHEQSRNDRSAYINIDWGNIRSGREHNFQTYNERGLSGWQIGTFDFNSIMLYPALITDADMVNNTSIPTMTRLDGTTWGTNFFLSWGDVETLQYLYGGVYIRVTYISDQNNNQDMYNVYNSGTVVMDFYSDAAGTIPATLSNPIDVRYYVSTTGDCSSYVYNYTDMLIPAGTPGQVTVGSYYTQNSYNSAMDPISCSSQQVGVQPGVGYRFIY